MNSVGLIGHNLFRTVEELHPPRSHTVSLLPAPNSVRFNTTPLIYNAYSLTCCEKPNACEVVGKSQQSIHSVYKARRQLEGGEAYSRVLEIRHNCTKFCLLPLSQSFDAFETSSHCEVRCGVGNCEGYSGCWAAFGLPSQPHGGMLNG